MKGYKMSNHTSAQNDYKKYAEIIKIIKKVTNGGRNLWAIHENTELSQIEKHLMLTIAAYADFTKLDSECSYCESKTALSINRLLKLMSLKDRGTMIKYAEGLEEKGYIKKIQTFSEDDKKYETNAFIITDKIFVVYAQKENLDLDSFKKKDAPKKGETPSDLPPTQPPSGSGCGPLPPPHTVNLGSGCGPLGVVGDANYNIPNSSLLGIHNNKLLCRDGVHGTPIKQGKSKKSTPKERSRKLFRTIYRRVRQDHEPESKFVRMVTNEQMDTVFDRLYEKYPEEAFTKLYSDVEEARLLGARDWNPNAPEAHLNHICEKYDIKMKTPLNG